MYVQCNSTLFSILVDLRQFHNRLITSETRTMLISITGGRSPLQLT